MTSRIGSTPFVSTIPSSSSITTGNRPAITPTWGTPDSGRTGFDGSAGRPSLLGIAGQAVGAGLKSVMASLKQVPFIGNALNLVNAAGDLAALTGSMLFNRGSSQERWNRVADLAHHTVGIFNTSVGANYDRGEARVEMAAAGAELGARIFGLNLPPVVRQMEPIIAAGYGTWSAARQGQVPLSATAALALSGLATVALPTLAGR